MLRENVFPSQVQRYTSCTIRVCIPNKRSHRSMAVVAEPQIGNRKPCTPEVSSVTVWVSAGTSRTHIYLVQYEHRGQVYNLLVNLVWRRRTRQLAASLDPGTLIGKRTFLKMS